MTKMTDTGSGVVRNITWDSENRMIQSSDNGSVVSYSYDHSGQRVYKSSRLGSVVYVNNNYVVRNNDLISKHVFVGTTRIASKLLYTAGGNQTDGGTYYFHPDHLGSSSVISNKSGEFHEALEYFPYGEVCCIIRRIVQVILLLISLLERKWIRRRGCMLLSTVTMMQG